jgi:hypothetical protein
MRKFILLTAVLMAVPAATAAEEHCGCFTPTPEQVTAFEDRIADLPEPLYRYARYYAGWSFPPATFQGHTVVPLRIQAQFVPLKPGEASAVHIVEGHRMPPLQGEGCVANVGIAPVSTSQIYPRCNQPGGWTPSATEIAELERRLVLPQDAAPLERYARHYAGVTDSGVRLIHAVFVDVDGTTPGVVIESEVELPLVADGGCGAINLDYNPATKQGSVRCNGIG